MALFCLQTAGWAAIIIDDSTSSWKPGTELQILEDPAAKLDEKGADTTHNYKPGTDTAPGFGFTNSAYWIRFEITAEPTGNDLVLELEYPLMDQVKFCKKTTNGFECSETGYALPFSTRPMPFRNFAFPIRLESSETAMFLIRFKNDDRMEMPMTVWKRDAFLSKCHNEQFVYGIYYGVICILAAFSLILYIITRDTIYLHYLVFVSAYGFFQLTQNGFTYEYLQPRSLSAWNHYIPFSILFTLFGTVLFCRTLLETATRQPRMHRFLNGLLLLHAITALAAPALPYTAAIMISVVLTIITLVGVFSAGMASVFKKYEPGYYYLCAWSAIIVCATVYALRVLGALPANFFTLYSMQAGSLIQFVLLTLGIGHRINLVMRENERSQVLAIDNLQKENRILGFQKELEIARAIQSSILPVTMPVYERLRIATRYIPMEAVGGDYYDFHKRENGLGVIVADVSGHGIPSALIASMLKVAFSMQEDVAHEPAAVIYGINRTMVDKIGDQFISAIYFYLDFAASSITVSSAGHFPVLVHRRKNDIIHELRPTGRVMGLAGMSGNMQTFDIETGDRIVIFTDGIIECRNDDGELIGYTRFLDGIHGFHGKSTESFLDALLDSARAWLPEGSTFEDDITLIALDIL